jgi:hypothetical protein
MTLRQARVQGSGLRESVPEWALALAGLTWVGFEFTGQLTYWNHSERPVLGVLAMILMLATIPFLVSHQAWERYGRRFIWIFVVLVCVAVLLVTPFVEPRFELTYANAIAGTVAAPMVGLVFRGRPWWAVAGIVASESLLFAFNGLMSIAGLLQPLIPVLGVLVCVVILRTLVHMDDLLASEIEQAESARFRKAVFEAREAARRSQSQLVLELVGPLMQRAARGESIDERDASDAERLQTDLRDRIRGGRLIDDLVRILLARVRERGTRVMLLDDGPNDAATDRLARRTRTTVAEVSRAVLANGPLTVDLMTVRIPPDGKGTTIVIQSSDWNALGRLHVRLEREGPGISSIVEHGGLTISIPAAG